MSKKIAVASKKLAKIRSKNSKKTGKETAEEGVRGMIKWNSVLPFFKFYFYY